MGEAASSAEIAAWLPLVRRLARGLLARLPANVEVDDLVQAGSLGLLDALARFDAEQGQQFETFASHRIRGSMLDELRRGDWLSRTDRRDQRRLAQARHYLQHWLGREPSESEMAERLGVPLPALQDMRDRLATAAIVSLDDLVAAGAPARESALAPSAEATCLFASQAGLAARAYARLSPEDQALLAQLVLDERTTVDLAAERGCSASRISQRASRALRRAQEHFRALDDAATPYIAPVQSAEDLADWERRNIRGSTVSANSCAKVG